MKEQNHIVSFWQTTQQLHRIAAFGGQEANGSDLDTWIKRYENLVSQLAGDNPQGAGSASDARACWKTAQDILIRLRRVHTNTQAPRQDHALFTKEDAEALDLRLLKIQQRLNIALGVTPATE